MKKIISLHKTYYALIGLGIICLILLQATVTGLRWEKVFLLQQRNDYKQITGYVLLLLIAYQWYLGLSRYHDKQFIKKIAIHKSIGLTLPLGFYFHAMQYGHAYQIFMWVLFIVCCLTAYLNPEVVRLRFANWPLYWFVLHITLSSLLTVLLIYHLYVVYDYS